MASGSEMTRMILCPRCATANALRYTSRLMKSNRAVVLIWVLFLLRGTFYATVIPIWEGLDEFAHFAYVDWLRTHATLPEPDARV